MSSQDTVVHARFCSDEKCARTYHRDPGDAKFQCHRCERWVGYCMGADDDMPGLCDDCFVIIDCPEGGEEESPWVAADRLLR